MPVELLVGDDVATMEARIATYKLQIDPAWQLIDYVRVDAEQLEWAIQSARSRSLSGGNRLIVVTDCRLKQWGNAEQAALQELVAIPEENTLVLLASQVDKRLKVYKLLKQVATIHEYNLPSPWRTDLIERRLADQAIELGLSLEPELLSYLALAIGTDFVRSRSELQKLRLFAQTEPLTLATVQALVECRTQNALQLATAMRTGAVAQVAQLMQELLAKSEPILVIIATLLTQFRTWLWVKSAMLGGMQRDGELARLCQIHNPNRLYYLRQEVANLSVGSLVATMQDLLCLETTLKQGRLRAIAVLPAVVTITRRFQLA